jgi:iron(III) transport system ATP-binding protein
MGLTFDREQERRTVLDVTDLYKQYQSVDGTPGGGVFGATFTIREGELFTLLGPSGCGKTTTLRSIAGLEKPEGGRICLAGTDLYDAARKINVPMYDRDIGMVFQSYAIWPHMTVFENAAYPLTVGKKRVTGAALRSRVMEILALVGLESFAERPAPQLSGGQQQRLALARALTRQPGLLLLDEPLSNLDAQLREQMRAELKRLQKETGVTAIYVTHDQVEALAISDRIAVMKDGLIMQLGSPREIYSRPTSEFVAQFIGRTNLLRGRLATTVAAGAEGRVETPLGPLVCTFPAATEASPHTGVVIRPENIYIARPEAADTLPPGNRVEGIVRAETYLGEIVEYEVEVGGTLIFVRARADTGVATNAPAALCFPIAQTLALIEDGA